MTSSVAELASDVYSVRLGLVDIRKQPTAEQRSRVQRLYAQKYAELAQQDQAYWPQGEIPDLVVGALGRIIGEELCSGIGMPVPTESDGTAGEQVSIGTKGQRMLARLLARERTGMATQAEYF